MTEPSIVVRNLSKSYGSFQALDDISFEVEPGEIVGFLGPNGAGKTTTMKILTCFMAASDGTASVVGHDVYEASGEVRRRIGYLPENVPLYEEMMVYDYLNFIAEIRGVEKARRKERIRKVVELTGLESMIHRNIIELSKGFRQRVGLAQAIIHEPDVVILDEPTTGLDPNQIVEIRDLIKEIGREKTVIFSTHILQEVAAVCDRIIVIHRGKIIADGTLAELSQRVAEDERGILVTLTKTDGLEPKDALEEVDATTAITLRGEDHSEATYHLKSTDPSRTRRSLVDVAADRDLDIVSLSTYRPTLEDVFRKLTGGESAEAVAALSGEREESEPEPKPEEPAESEPAEETDEQEATDEEKEPSSESDESDESEEGVA